MTEYARMVDLQLLKNLTNSRMIDKILNASAIETTKDSADKKVTQKRYEFDRLEDMISDKVNGL